MRAIFIISNGQTKDLNEGVDKILDYVDETLKEPVIRVVDVPNLNDKTVFEEFKTAVDEDDFDLYIMKFIGPIHDMRDIEAMLKEASYNYSSGNEILILEQNDLDTFMEQICKFGAYQINPDEMKFENITE